MQREYPKHPIVGVGGIVFRGKRVLLAKRNQDPGKGQWSLPGGMVELGETLEQALMREIREEAGIEIQIRGLARLLERIIHDDGQRIRYHYVIADYWAEMVSGEPRAASDVSDLRFVPLEEVPGMAVHRDVKDTIGMAVKMREPQ
jgi:mutator protein MutT